jgi:hypothetical protein
MSGRNPFPKHVNVTSARRNLERGNGKCDAAHGKPLPVKMQAAWLNRAWKALGGEDGELHDMENGDYLRLSRDAFTEQICTAQDSTKLIIAIHHALGQCGKSDAVGENMELFAAMIPVPSTWEALYKRYEPEWQKESVAMNVGEMLSHNEELEDLLVVLLATFPEDAQLGELYDKLFDEE